MATFAELQSSVSKRLLDPNNQSVSSADVGDAINAAISYWKLRRFWFNEGYDSVTMTINDGTIATTGDVLVPVSDNDGFNIEYGSMRYPLRKLSQQEYDAVWLNNGYGLPRSYARVGGTFQAYPLPDQAYTVRRHYLKNYTPLVNAADTNDFTINADRLITLWTCANLSAEFRQDDKMETYYRGAAQDEYKNLCIMSDKSNGTGRVTIYSVL